MPEHFGGPMGVPDMVPSWMPAHFVLGVFCWMRAVRSSYQSYGEEVRTLVVHPARIDVVSICLHDAYTECARGSQKSTRLGLRAKRISLLPEVHGLSPDCIVAPRRRNNRNG
jgi:hypothetical protein